MILVHVVKSIVGKTEPRSIELYEIRSDVKLIFLYFKVIHYSLKFKIVHNGGNGGNMTTMF